MNVYSSEHPHLAPAQAFGLRPAFFALSFALAMMIPCSAQGSKFQEDLSRCVVEFDRRADEIDAGFGRDMSGELVALRTSLQLHEGAPSSIAMKGATCLKELDDDQLTFHAAKRELPSLEITLTRSEARMGNLVRERDAAYAALVTRIEGVLSPYQRTITRGIPGFDEDLQSPLRNFWDKRRNRGVVSLGKWPLLVRQSRDAPAPPIGPLSLDPTKETHPRPESLNQVEKSLVIVQTPGCVGSGFLARMGDKTYVVSSQHVVQGAASIQLVSLSGHKLQPKAMDLAEQDDLVRFLVDTADLGAAIAPLALAAEPLRVGAPVHVFGNSGDAGVAMYLHGTALGIGRQVIEVDATFVPGNSGGPILDDAGRVHGVAAVHTLASNRDWINSSPRFAETRRFGSRLTDQVSWVAVQPAAYQRLGGALNDMDLFFTELITVVKNLDYRSFSGSQRTTHYEHSYNQVTGQGGMRAVKSGAIGTQGLSETFIDGKYDEAAALKKYRDPRWPRAVANLYTRFGQGKPGGSERANASAVERNDTAILTALKANIQTASQTLQNTRWQSKFQQEQAKGMVACATLLSAHVDKLFADKKARSK